MRIFLIALCTVAGYFIGCLSPAVFMSRKVGGFDIRSKGSGNAGTTNMLRTMGWRMGVFTFVLDYAKGALPALLGIWLGELTGTGRLPAYLIGYAVLLGHAFPVTARFKGGKCVATGAGVLTALFPIPTLIAIAADVVFLLIVRIVSLGSILVFPIYAAVMFFVPVPDAFYPWFCVLTALLVVFLHRENIRRLLHGNEKKLHVATKKERSENSDQP